MVENFELNSDKIIIFTINGFTINVFHNNDFYNNNNWYIKIVYNNCFTYKILHNEII